MTKSTLSFGSRALLIGGVMVAACSSGLPAEKAKPGSDGGSSGSAGDDGSMSGGDGGTSSGGTSSGGTSSGGTSSGGTSSGGKATGGSAGSGGSAAKSGSAGSGATSDGSKLSWGTEVVVDPDEASEQPALALDADGNAWALWNRVRNEYDNIGEVHVRHYDAAQDAWEDDVVLDDQRTASTRLALAGASNGDAVAAWAKADADDATSLTLRAAYYSAEDGTWSEVADLAPIAKKDLGGIRITVGTEGTALVGWSNVAVDNLKDENGFILMSRVRMQIVTSWFNGKWRAPQTAVDVVTPETGTWSDTTSVSDRLPVENFDLTLEDDDHARALVSWDDGVRAVVAAGGEWGDPEVLTEDRGSALRIVRLPSGYVLAAFVADGSLYASSSAAGDPSFSKPELLEHNIDSVGSVELGAAPEGAPIDAAITWITGDPYNFGAALVAVLHDDGSWSEPSQVYRTFTGYPQIGVTDRGHVLVGGGKDWPWVAMSPDGESWPADGATIGGVYSGSINRPLRFGVSSSGLAMFLWADGGQSDMKVSNHLLAIVGK